MTTTRPEACGPVAGAGATTAPVVTRGVGVSPQRPSHSWLVRTTIRPASVGEWPDELSGVAARWRPDRCRSPPGPPRRRARPGRRTRRSAVSRECHRGPRSAGRRAEPGRLERAGAEPPPEEPPPEGPRPAEPRPAEPQVAAPKLPR